MESQDRYDLSNLEQEIELLQRVDSLAEAEKQLMEATNMKRN